MNLSALEGKQPSPTVLVVDDDPGIREGLSAALCYAGFEVITAATGTEAVRAAWKFQPDLILLDVTLPELNGFDVARELRGSGIRLPIIFLSGRDSPDDRRLGLVAGGNDYMTKPFSLREVIARVHALVRTARDSSEDTWPSGA
jgi:two-component system OmpR family response regulator